MVDGEEEVGMEEVGMEAGIKAEMEDEEAAEGVSSTAEPAMRSVARRRLRLLEGPAAACFRWWAPPPPCLPPPFRRPPTTRRSRLSTVPAGVTLHKARLIRLSHIV